MSVGIMWRSTSDKGKRVGGGTSNSLQKFKEVFGQTVSSDDVRTLRAMAIASKDEFFSQVADIVENVGEIEIWGEY